MGTGRSKIGVALLVLCAATALAGCGRKNLPVAPSGSAVSGRVTDDPNNNAPASLGNFQRSNRVTSSGGDDLRITPAEVARNPGASKRRFLLDGLLN